jgi:hypothetical protein
MKYDTDWLPSIHSIPYWARFLAQDGDSQWIWWGERPVLYPPNHEWRVKSDRTQFTKIYCPWAIPECGVLEPDYLHRCYSTKEFKQLVRQRELADNYCPTCENHPTILKICPACGRHRDDNKKEEEEG